MTQVEANGIHIEYERRGSGEPLLLVMGLGAQLVAWPESLIDNFVDQGFDVIWFDNRDIGLSTKIDAPTPTIAAQLGVKRRSNPGPAYVLSDMAEDAAGLLSALNITSAHVVGVSMGGMICQTLAIEHPGRVRSLTSIMSNTGDKRHGLPDLRKANRLRKLMTSSKADPIKNQVELFGLIGGPLVDPDVVRATATRGFERNPDRTGIARQAAAITASPDRTSRLGKVNTPTLVIHGLVDTLVGFSGGVATVKAIPGARLLALPDMGHDLPGPRLQEIADAIVLNTRRYRGASNPE